MPRGSAQGQVRRGRKTEEEQCEIAFSLKALMRSGRESGRAPRLGDSPVPKACAAIAMTAQAINFASQVFSPLRASLKP